MTKTLHGIAPRPWRYVNRGQEDTFEARWFGDIICAEGWNVAEYVYADDAEAIIAAIHAQPTAAHSPERKE